MTSSFVIWSVLGELEAGEATAIAQALIDLEAPRLNDKWGPAGRIELGAVPFSSPIRRFLFFAWAFL
jgi:hypothetical protein